jgi:hypothetical protein
MLRGFDDAVAAESQVMKLSAADRIPQVDVISVL